MARVLVGLIGSGIRKSLSPAMHEREAAALGMDYEYRILELDSSSVQANDLDALLSGLQRQGYRGINVTYPFKQAVIPLLDQVSTHVQALGAANIVLFEGGRRIGDNSDWSGFAESFRRGLPGVRADEFLLLGAGGAGSAVAYGMLSQGTKHVWLHDPDRVRLETLLERVESHFGPGRASAVTDPRVAIGSAPGVINATPIGMDFAPGTPIPAEWLNASQWVADLIYLPLETEFIRRARQLGCRTLNGGGMAVFQAADAFRAFSGVSPDVDRMLRHFADLTEGRALV